MTYISEKALALVNFERGRLQQPLLKYPPAGEVFIVLCRVMEQHEAYSAKLNALHEAQKEEYSDFRKEVSNAVKQADLLDLHGTEGAYKKLHRFIIAKPDPLVEALAESGREFGPDWGWGEQAKALRAALDARGLEIKEKGQ
jgi:hypothetical protein